MVVVVIGVLAGVWFIGMGAYGMTHAERSPEGPAGHWLSFPSGRRIGGAMAMILGALVVLGSLTLL